MIFALLTARFVLAAIFALAGFAKLFNFEAARKSVGEFGVPRPLAPSAARILPLTELILAVALIPLSSAEWASVGVLCLLALFIGAIAVNLARGRRPDCACFGQLHSAPVGWKTMFRNASLAAVAAFVIWEGPSHSAGVSMLWRGLAGFETAAAALGAAIALLAGFQLWALLHLMKQNGRLLLRLDELEARVGPAPPAPPKGLPVDTPAPSFSLTGLKGETVTLEDLSRQDKPLVLFFYDPNCGPCEAALPELAQWQRELSERVRLVPIVSGGVEANRIKAEKYGIRDVLLQTRRETSSAYLVNGTPGAVLVSGGLIASPVASGIDEVRALVSRATLPRPVKRGEPAPSLRLPDLKGNPVDLGNLRGRRTLLLFWNPECGFCRQMLDDVKAWERRQAPDAPELLVISSGELKANQEQGFRARVLLDPYSAASQVFRSSGTPSAVMLNDEGIVASEVAEGASGVLELAGVAPAPERLIH